MGAIAARAKMMRRRTVVGGFMAAALAACDKDQPQPPKPASTHDLVELIALDPTIHLDLRYATVNNLTGRILYSQPRALMQTQAAAALVRAHHRAQAVGFGLTIFDAYRPWRVTKQLWDATPVAQHHYVANPKQGSRHNRGCAVDLTLHRLSDGAVVEMPSVFDDFSARAHRVFLDASQIAIANRTRLARLMEAEQFEERWDEWWHFDFHDWHMHPVLDLPFEDV
ncbi:MAG: hypothetical protein RL367_2036 [Pseudomonadota bacterium]